MTDISHALLTGSELHEPKGVETASLGEVYVADGNGSGNWNNIGTSSFTGMIADFVWPVVQNGWLELDGSDINTTTYSALYDVMTIQMTGTRVISTATITSLSSTTNMRVGYYVFGTGITSGTTILSIDSSTQITLSASVSSSGTATVVVSPWLLNTGTIRLPNASASGRYRRSRTSSTKVGDLQSSSNIAHTHGVSGTTGLQSSNHTHTFSGTTGSQNANHTHNYTADVTNQALQAGSSFSLPIYQGTTTSGVENQNHQHSYSGTTSLNSGSHSHTFSTTSDSSGTTETRPETLVVMTCVKT